MSIADKVLIKAQYTVHAAKNMKKLGYNELKPKEVCLHLPLGQGYMYIIFDRLATYIYIYIETSMAHSTQHNETHWASVSEPNPVS